MLLMISALKPDDTVEMSVWRNGELITISADLVERPRPKKW